MQKKITIITLFTLILIAAAVLAVPVPTVVYPNGGETLYGAIDILFNAYDTTKPQTFDANLYYSTAQGGKEYTIDTNVNLLSICDFPTGALTNADYEFTAMTLNHAYGESGVRLAFIDGNFVNITKVSSTTWAAWWWSETDKQWYTSNSLQNSIPAVAIRSWTLFNYNEKVYMLYNGLDNNTLSLFWNSDQKKWNYENNFAKGLTLDDQLHIFSVMNVVSHLGQLILFTDNNSFVWSGTSWVADNYWVSNINNLSSTWSSQKKHRTIFDVDGVLWAIQPDLTIDGAYFNETTHLWVRNEYYSEDINATVNKTDSHFHFISNVIDYYSIKRVLTIEQWFFPEPPYKYNAFSIYDNGYKTQTPSSCTYHWASPATGHWFLNIYANSLAGTGWDSSDTFFYFQSEPPPPETNDAWEATAINGISQLALSTSTNDLNITAIGTDIEFKVKHIRVYDDELNVKTFYGNTDGKQFWVYTIDCGTTDNCTNYQNGLWTFDAGLTLDDGLNHPMQKIWDVSQSAYEYKFIHEALTVDYVYYKLVYKEPMRNWNSIDENSDWIRLNNPTTTGNWDSYTASYINNIYSQLLIKIPDLNSDCTPQPACRAYDFQFTAYADTPTNLKILSLKDGIETYITTITLTTTPTRYKAPVYDDYLIFKTELTSGAAQIKMRDYALLQRGYFKTSLEIKTMTGSDLPAERHPNTIDHTPADYNTTGITFNTDTNVGQTFTTGKNLDQIATITVYAEKDWWWADALAQTIAPIHASLYTDSTKTELLGTTTGYTVGTPYVSNCNPLFPIGAIIPSIATLSWCEYTLIGGEPIEFDFGTPAEPNTEYYIEFSADFSSVISANKEAGLKISTTDFYEGQAYQNTTPIPTKDLKMIIEEEGSYQALDEGEPFRAISSAYNNQNTPQGLANTLKITLYNDIYNDANRIKILQYEIPETTGNIPGWGRRL